MTAVVNCSRLILNLGAVYTNFSASDSEEFMALSIPLFSYNLRAALELDFLVTLTSFLKLGAESGVHIAYAEGADYNAIVIDVPVRVVGRFDLFDWLYLQPYTGVLISTMPSVAAQISNDAGDPSALIEAGLRVKLGPFLLDGAYLYDASFDTLVANFADTVTDPHKFRLGVFWQLGEYRF